MTPGHTGHLRLLSDPAVREQSLAHAGSLWHLPGPEDSKFSGVVGVHAGSDRYPGAALLCLSAACRATAPMVRYAGPVDPRLIALHQPEVVSAPHPANAGTVDAWVVGPGLDPEADHSSTLAALMGAPTPLLLDATALRVLADDPALRDHLARRGSAGALTVLTPHDGEFQALARAYGVTDGLADAAPATAARCAGAVALAEALPGTIVVRKGRVTICATAAEPPQLIDSGQSWAATPGSGDVLAGLMGALLAAGSGTVPALSQVGAAVVVHACAAEYAARTPAGYAPIVAGDISTALRPIIGEALALSHRVPKCPEAGLS